MNPNWEQQSKIEVAKNTDNSENSHREDFGPEEELWLEQRALECVWSGLYNNFKDCGAIGISIVPANPATGDLAIPTDGGITSDCGDFRKVPASDIDWDRWERFSGSAFIPGLAAMCGTVSGNLVCVSFEGGNPARVEEAWTAFLGTLPAKVGMKLVTMETPNGHTLFCRTGGLPEVSRVFAEDAPSVIIKIIGEGGHAFMPGTPGYKMDHGDLDEICVLSSTEWQQIINALDEVVADTLL